jgi:UDP-N-acetylmuramoylalanine--D-glutamate ligase
VQPTARRVGVDDEWCAARRAHRAQRQASCASRCAAPARRHLSSNGDGSSGLGGKTQPIAQLDGIGSLRGLHNAQNAACAARRRWRSARRGGDPDGLRSFPGLAHRMEQVGRKGAVLFVNDSKATNADSSAQALACFTTFSGSPAASRRPAASPRSPDSSRASARPI